MNLPQIHGPGATRPVLPPWQRVARLIVFVLPFAAALGAAWWSLNRLRPALKDSATATARVSRISSPIEDMERLQERRVAQRMQQRYQESLGSYVDGEEALQSWLADLRTFAGPLSLGIKTELGEPVNLLIAGESLSLIPVRVELVPDELVPNPRSTYQRLLEFCQYVASHPKRADLDEFHVTGASGAVSHAQLSLNLWARTPRS
jgi:Tfp pilus assembly protein PilO